MNTNNRLVLFAGCLATCWLLAVHAQAESELSRGPYLQLATPQSIYIVWRTNEPIEPVVRYGATTENIDSTVSGDAIRLRVSADVQADEEVPRLFFATEENRPEGGKQSSKLTESAPLENTYQYEALIDGLEPGQRYYYAVYNGAQRIAGGDESYTFQTLQESGTPTNARIWVLGDSGTGGQNQRLVYEAMKQYVSESGRALDYIIHVGDMAYLVGSDEQFSRNFFDVYDDTLRNTVCWPTMGNHEGRTSRGLTGIGPYYDAYVVPTEAEAGGVPSGSEAYYSFQIGTTHFVCLDSHDLDRTPTGAMAQWLRADLERATGNWLVAFWHHPPYTKGTHDSDVEGQLLEMRTHIMPILEGAGVDIVLTGHSHIYERSMLMDGAYSTPTTAEGVILDDGDGNPEGNGPYRKSPGLQPHQGTVQIVSGHGGAGIARRGTMPVMREIIVEHGSVILDIVGDRLVGTMLDKHGDRRDFFSIVKDKSVTPKRVANPWQPQALKVEPSAK